jgi:glutamyl-tRNA synthetase
VKVVTRFAPSPTGAPHLGLARTALFNWAFARHHGGTFYLRFEDTDQARSTLESERIILDALRWVGIDHDPVPGTPNGTPRQSERSPRYRAVASELLAAGKAYRCVCTTEQVEAMREKARLAGLQPRYDGTCRERNIGPDSEQPFCVRLRVPEDAAPRWNDLIAGPGGQDGTLLDDFVLQRTDGSPIYHFAVVVDDHDMGVTHVIRAREHLTSTPRQLLLYAALGWSPPEFAHVPVLTDGSGKKLSKRSGEVALSHYREEGILPDALVNFIARLGWSHGDLEIFTRAQLVELFDLKDIGRSPSQVHDDKLLWLNQHYIQNLPLDALFAHARPFLEAEAGQTLAAEPRLLKLVDLLRPRSKTLRELAERARFCLRDTIEIDPGAARKHLRAELREPLAALRDALAKLDDASWQAPVLERTVHELVAAQGIQLGDLAQAVRVALVGSAASPGIFDTLEVVGRPKTLARLDAARLFDPVQRGH